MAIVRRTKRARKIIVRRSKFGRNATHELLIHRTNLHIYAYVIDMSSSKVMFSCSSNTKESRVGSNVELAKKVGINVATKCKELKIEPVVNIAEYRFHGRVKALVDMFTQSLKN